MKVAILGGTGFVGHYMVEALSQQGLTPRVLIRNTRSHKPIESDHIEWIAGSLEDTESLQKLLDGADAVIYNIGILRAYPTQGISFEKLQYAGVVKTATLAQELGVKRFILMSANGVEQGLTPYQQTKAAAEDHLKTTKLDWTIFRPSVIFGEPHGRTEFASMLKRDIIDSPLPAPLFYEGLIPRHAGNFQFSPVHVADVAQAFARSLEKSQTIGKTYKLGGPEELSWREILTLIAQVDGKQKLMLPVPAFAPSMAAALLDRFAWFPISKDQIRMLLKGNICRGDAIFSLCDIQPKAFNQQTIQYLRSENNPASDGSASAY